MLLTVELFVHVSAFGAEKFSEKWVVCSNQAKCSVCVAVFSGSTLV